MDELARFGPVVGEVHLALANPHFRRRRRRLGQLKRALQHFFASVFVAHQPAFARAPPFANGQLRLSRWSRQTARAPICDDGAARANVEIRRIVDVFAAIEPERIIQTPLQQKLERRLFLALCYGQDGTMLAVWGNPLMLGCWTFWWWLRHSEGCKRPWKTTALYAQNPVTAEQEYRISPLIGWTAGRSSAALER